MKRYPVSKPTLGAAERNALLATIDSGWITHGPAVEKFEDLLEKKLGVNHAVACTSGTTALHLALLALNLKPGDEVLVPDVTYVATANAVRYVGATPVLVDINPHTWNMSLHEGLKRINARTKAVLLVHLYGVPCDMESWVDVCERNRLFLIEDAAQSIGATHGGKCTGTFGLMGCFSFFGNKIVTTGEGGAVVTNDRILAEKLHHLRGQAQCRKRYFHSEVGYNYRMTDMQASIGVAQLEQLEKFLYVRSKIDDEYRRLFEDLPVTTQMSPMNSSPARWLFTVMLNQHFSREAVMNKLDEMGVETRPTFVPLHQLPMYSSPGRSFHAAYTLGRLGMSFPTYADMTRDDVREIVDRFRKVVGL